MSRAKRTGNTGASRPAEAGECSMVCCQCADLADAIVELTRQVHLLGVIIDELVSEFHWQNNQMGEQLRRPTDTIESSMPVPTATSGPVGHRTTLFD